MNFDDFNIGDEIKEAIEDMGFTKTTPIQSRAIPDALKGIDIIGQAPIDCVAVVDCHLQFQFWKRYSFRINLRRLLSYVLHGSYACK